MYQGYDKWNESLFEYFFGKHNSQKVDYLYANEEVLMLIGKKLNIPEGEVLNDFCLSVKTYIRDVYN